MMNWPDYLEEKKYHGTLVGCGMLSFLGVTSGMLVAFTIGSTCGLGYLLLGLVSGTSFVLIKNMKVSKDLETSVNILQSENVLLQENNEKLNLLSENLQSDIDIISESIKLVGESTDDFMEKLRTNYEKLKQENDRHKTLNRQQAMYQLMQIFRHFDTNQDFFLNDEELKENEVYIKSMFPKFNTNLFNNDANSISYKELCDMLLPN